MDAGRQSLVPASNEHLGRATRLFVINLPPSVGSFSLLPVSKIVNSHLKEKDRKVLPGASSLKVMQLGKILSSPKNLKRGNTTDWRAILPPRGVVVSVLSSHVKDAGFDSRLG